MKVFHDKKQKAEEKHVRDQELEFKVGARRNKLLGLWLAEMLGLAGTDAEAYAKEVVSSDFEEPGDEDVLRKVLGDFTAKGVDKSEHQVRRQMDDLMAEARRQIMDEVEGS